MHERWLLSARKPPQLLGALGKLTGLLANKHGILAPDSINQAKRPAQFQMIFFFLGLAVSAVPFVISGISNF